MSMTPVTAVFDIGKTNKKFLLFDLDYRVVFKQQTELELIEDDDGDPCENWVDLEQWMQRKLKQARSNEDFEIKALNFSGYGATLVHLGENGRPAAPIYDYLKEYPSDLLGRFYQQYGGKEHFSVVTASPPMGMLNSGLQLYWLKHKKPDMFDRIAHTLHFPQYLAHIFSGSLHSELTSVGCHTGLWNFREDRYHHWVREEGIDPLFPSMQPVTTSEKQDDGMRIGIGIHDSSAALAPYLVGMDDPFMLVSTGTWSITFNPFNPEPLTFGELKRDCLSYINIYGEPVKASRVFLGREFSHQKKKLDRHFNSHNAGYEMEPDPELLEKLVRNANPEKKLELEQAHGSGPYPSDEPGHWDPGIFGSYTEAYHQLMLDLASIQADCITLVEGEEPVNQMVVTGGFSQNTLFNRLLASLLPGKDIYSASLPHASALGAAMVVNGQESFVNEQQKELLTLTRHQPLPVNGIKGYRWRQPGINGSTE